MPPHYVCCVFGTVFARSKTCHQLAQTPAFVREPDPSVERTGAHRSGGIPRPPADQVYAANRTYGVKLRREGYAGLWTARGAGTAWPTAESWGASPAGGPQCGRMGQVQRRGHRGARLRQDGRRLGRVPQRGRPGHIPGAVRDDGRAHAPDQPPGRPWRSRPLRGGGGHGLAGDSTVAYTALVKCAVCAVSAAGATE